MGVKSTTVDFSGVKDRGDHNPKQVAEGDYAAKIVKVVDTPSKAGEPMYTFTIKLGKFSQNSYPYYCVVKDTQLWKLRNIATAAGLNVPKKRMKFDPNKLVGKQIGVTMVDDEPYTNDKGKTTTKSVIDAIFPLAELADGPEVPDEDDPEFDEGGPQLAGTDDSEDEAEAPKPKKKKDKGKKAKAEEPVAEEPKKGKKKGKKKKGSEENLEELDISDL